MSWPKEPWNKIHLDSARVLEMYDSGLSTNHIAEILHCHKAVIVKVVKPVRKLRGPKPLDPEKVKLIPELYQTMSGPKIARQLNTTCTAVYHYLHRAQVKTRTCRDYDRESPCRHDFFDAIDTQQKAYWLGMMITDGCVSRNDEVILSLHARDLAHVEAFRETLESEAKITIRTAAKVFGGYTWTGKSACVRVKSRRLAAALSHLGIVPAKTGHTFLPPGIPPELLPHFWRGAIDGDGWLCWGARRNGKRQFVLGFTGNLALVEAFQNFCNQHTFTAAHIHPNGRIHRFTVADFCAIDIARLLYAGAAVYLDRKHELYQEALLDYATRSRHKRSRDSGTERSK